MSPSESAVVNHGDTLAHLDSRGNAGVAAGAVKWLETLAAAVKFSKAEGLIRVPECAHPIRVAIDAALK
jgi:predicted alternative tryptophan synthase beta-subunit